MQVRFRGLVLEIQWSHYANGNPAMILWGDDPKTGRRETYCVASVNPPPYDRLGAGLVAVKDWSENEGMLHALVESGVVEEDVVDVRRSGHVFITIHRLTAEAVEDRRQQGADNG